MSSIIKIGDRETRLTRTPRSANFLAPMPPARAAQKLDEALHGKKGTQLLITRESTRRRFDGGVQGPSFWVQSRAATLNPLEKRVEGVLVPCGGSTEVRAELRGRFAGAATIGTGAGVLGVLTVIVVPIAILVDTLPWVGGAGRLALLTMLAGLWALFAVAVYAAKRVGRSGEAEAMRFLAATLEAPDRDLLGLE